MEICRYNFFSVRHPNALAIGWDFLVLQYGRRTNLTRNRGHNFIHNFYSPSLRETERGHTRMRCLWGKGKPISKGGRDCSKMISAFFKRNIMNCAAHNSTWPVVKLLSHEDLMWIVNNLAHVFECVFHMQYDGGWCQSKSVYSAVLEGAHFLPTICKPDWYGS